METSGQNLDLRVEYRVVPTGRFTVTRYEETAKSGASITKGEYQNYDTAFEVAYALCKAEHERLGYPPGDERVQYPKRPTVGGAVVRGKYELHSADFRQRVAGEIDRIHNALGEHLRANDGAPHPALEAAQQALCWVMDSDGCASPFASIMFGGPSFGEEWAGLGRANPPGGMPVVSSASG